MKEAQMVLPQNIAFLIGQRGRQDSIRKRKVEKRKEKERKGSKQSRKEREEERKATKKMAHIQSKEVDEEDMEEVKVMMSSTTTQDSTMINESSAPLDPITTSTSCPTWKLYENPFYNPQYHHTKPQHQHHHQHCQSCSKHHLQLPLSTRKIAASFWDLTFFSPIMQTTELDIARAQILELKAELEYERKARKKIEAINKRLAKELAEEGRGREALERVCEELAREVSLDKAEINRMKKEMEEERKMLRMAEVIREERVQMKLAEAKILFEETLLGLEVNKQTEPDDENSSSKIEQKNQASPDIAAVSQAAAAASQAAAAANLTGKFNRLVLGEKSCDENVSTATNSRESTRAALSEKSSFNDNTSVPSTAIYRRASPEPENPHIKRGIKGFVEFPRVVRATGSKSSRHWGTKLECQKTQLRILLKQKSPVRSNNLIIS